MISSLTPKLIRRLFSIYNYMSLLLSILRTEPWSEEVICMKEIIGICFSDYCKTTFINVYCVFNHYLTILENGKANNCFP